MTTDLLVGHRIVFFSYFCSAMIVLLILIGVVVFAAVYAVAFLVMFVVAAVKIKNGSITQDDLKQATKEYRERKAQKSRRSAAESHDLMRFLGYK